MKKTQERVDSEARGERIKEIATAFTFVFAGLSLLGIIGLMLIV